MTGCLVTVDCDGLGTDLGAGLGAVLDSEDFVRLLVELLPVLFAIKAEGGLERDIGLGPALLVLFCTVLDASLKSKKYISNDKNGRQWWC